MMGTVISKKRTIEPDCFEMPNTVDAIHTGYFISDGHIWGPKSSGLFWIEGSVIRGPSHSGQYKIENGRIYGPDCSGDFWIENRHIYGISKTPPWLR